MLIKKIKDRSFVRVALAFILIGAAISAYGMAEWLFNVFIESTEFHFPAAKVMGGVIIMVLAYIQLEIELLRQKS